MSKSDIAIRVEGLGKRYRIGVQENRNGGMYRYKSLRDSLGGIAKRPLQMLKSAVIREPMNEENSFWALKDINFEVKKGEVVGIIGRNGAGKSTLLKILSRITKPTSGRVDLFGRVGSLLEVGTGFHPELSGRENIYLNGAILGMTRAEVKTKFDEIVAFSEIEKFLDTPVKQYSSGMYMRLAFAVAAHLEPEILVVDEVLAVGDAAFQKKCLGKMKDVAREGRTVLFVSHNMQAVKQLCPQVLLLDTGRVVSCGPSAAGIAQYFGVSGNGQMQVDLSCAERRSRANGALLESLTFGRSGPASASAAPLTRADELETLISFRLDLPVRSLQLAMAIIHADGTPVFSEVLSDERPLGPADAGSYRVSFRFLLAHLKAEAYQLTLFLINDNTVLDGVESIPLPLFHDPRSDPYIEARRWGVARVPVTWSPVACIERAA